jgi:hypothetical protein
MVTTTTAMFGVWHVRESERSGLVRPEDLSMAEVLKHLSELEAAADEGADALPELIRELSNPNPRMRCNALLALRRLGHEADSAGERVRQLLSDDDGRVRAHAIEVYAAIQRDTDSVARLAASMLADKEPLARVAATDVLNAVGPAAVSALFPLLQSDQVEQRLAGIRTLRKIGWDPSTPAVESVVRVLLSEPATHAAALMALAEHGNPTSAELRELLQQIPTNPSAVLIALGAMIRLGPAAIGNLPELLDILSDPQAAYFNQAIIALRAMKTSAQSAAPQLRRAFEQASGWHRVQLGWVLNDLGIRVDNPSLSSRIQHRRPTAGNSKQ